MNSFKCLQRFCSSWMVMCLLGIGCSANATTIIAVVGDSAITDTALANKTRLITQLMPQYKQLSEQELSAQVLESMLDDEMQCRLAKRIGISLTEQDQAMIKKSVAGAQGLSSEKLQKKLVKDGVNIKQFYQHLYTRALIDKVQKMVLAEKVRVGGSEIVLERKRQEKLLTEYYVKDVVFECADESEFAAKKQQALAFTKSWQGKKLSKQDLPKGSKMNTFAWDKMQALPDVLQAETLRLQDREVSTLIKADNGWHVIKMVKKRLPKGITLDDASLYQVIGAERMQVELNNWLKTLRAQTYVQRFNR